MNREDALKKVGDLAQTIDARATKLGERTGLLEQNKCLGQKPRLFCYALTIMIVLVTTMYTKKAITEKRGMVNAAMNLVYGISLTWIMYKHCIYCDALRGFILVVLLGLVGGVLLNPKISVDA